MRPSTLIAAAALLGWPAAAAATAAVTAGAGAADGAQALEQVNGVLRHWLSRLDADDRFLVVDGTVAQLRVHHGAAVLRQCTVVARNGGDGASVQRLTARLRRHRRSDPFHAIRPGAFDWEHYLVEQATHETALLFSGGLLLYAADAWEPARAPSIRLPAADLRALYDAAGDSLEILLLPAGWESPR